MERAKWISRSESRQSWILWVGALTGPAAWSLQLAVNYNLEEFACAPGTKNPGTLWGFGVETIVLFTDIVLAAATLVAGLLSLHCWRTNRKVGPSTTADRATWMAAVGVMVSVLFLIIILVGFAPPFLLSVCEATP